MNKLASWELPANVLARWEKAHGRQSVRDWQAAAPRLADEWARTWGVVVETILPGGSLSYALAGTRADGCAVVLKLLAPWSHAAATTEARALAGWKGCGVVELLEHSPNGRVLLLRRVKPGLPFTPSGVEAADCARVARTLTAIASAPEVAELPDLQTSVRERFARARASGREGAPVTGVQIDAAQSRALELAESASMRGPVHGDAQDKNLLVDEGGGLVAIDPEPALGDPHFDAALWALTHRPGEGVRERCAELARVLAFDEGRLWSWCLALAVAEVALDVPDRARAQRRLLQRAGLMND
jgi:streptomycin 6-kinase